jgi:hypothetical protein
VFAEPNLSPVERECAAERFILTMNPRGYLRRRA